ncbi:hypothetical protein KY290_037983 [Solanum tuberosum]|uniref:Neprosin PEP catalytic domain-containing protein n=1 Tax=Solanum tuberosum TaxID=4113 RepID=A0ABQ7TYY5_SOLTU|nr:hypothetical protein KY285_037338 [Solanum tuberosum]KAH0739278.1 hypothetical protein KY290_037983 [Solanum tuberosum]
MVFLCLSYDGVRGTKLSKQEDLELEKQLKVLNKPPIKTIKTKYGGIYDCVNFYEQPAFDHPLLKNHNYHPQMKPSFSMKESVSTISRSNYRSSRIGLPDRGCPVGTIPIRRTTKEDLIRHKLMPLFEDVMFNNSLNRLAIVHTEDFPGSKFGGAGDGKTSSCFNLLCPGFVLLNTQIPIDGDLEEGNWWLFSTESNTPFGFWPREVFDDDFAYYVTRVEWGGVVYSPPGILEPPMGSSFFPIENNNYDAFCKNMTLLSDRGGRLYTVESQLSTFLSNSDLYNVSTIPGLMYYGGPGEK